MDKNFIGVTFSNYKVVVNNAKKVSGHDDTLPFNADFEVYKDGNLFFDGKAWNDGWGGPSCLNYDKKNNKQKEEELDNVCQSIFTWEFTAGERKFEMTEKLVDVVETLAFIAIFFPKINSPVPLINTTASSSTVLLMSAFTAAQSVSLSYT